MLAVVKAPSLDALVDEVVPPAIRLDRPLSLPPAQTEYDYLRELRATAARNRVCKSLIGLGYADTITPPVILRNVFENPGWYTPYTPYQAEIAQGRLESLLNFQTMVRDLTGMDVANASLLDEPTAAAEAMTLLHRMQPKRATGPQHVPGVVAHLAADPRGAAVACRAARPDRARGGPGIRRVRRGRVRAAGAVSRRVRPGRRAVRPDRPRACRRRARGGGHGPAGADAADPSRRTRRRRRRRQLAAISACRSGTADRTRRFSRPGTRTCARCRAGSSACRWTAAGVPRTGWRCRPASSTSGARRRRRTSAPRRRCSPTWRRCTRSTTGPRGSARLRRVSERWRTRSARRSSVGISVSGTGSSSTRCTSPPPGARRRSPRRPSRPGSTCGRSTTTAWSSRSTRPSVPRT